MKYLRSFHLSPETVRNPNVYPYNIFKDKTGELFILDTITMFYGGNGSGKSTILNLLALKLGIKGGDMPKCFSIHIDYVEKYLSEIQITFEESEDGRKVQKPSEDSYYIKSEDILYEIKKIQQEAILQEGYLYQRQKLGMTREEVLEHKDSYKMREQIERLSYSQEKYSNGETSLQVYEDYLVPGGLYLLDEPEASLSPEKQLELIERIIEASRFLDCQFLIATHSPLFLGRLEGKIYDLNQAGAVERKWSDLESIKTIAAFFKENLNLFK